MAQPHETDPYVILSASALSSVSISVKPCRLPEGRSRDDNHVAAFGPGRLELLGRAAGRAAVLGHQHAGGEGANVPPIVIDRKRPPPGNHLLRRNAGLAAGIQRLRVVQHADHQRQAGATGLVRRKGARFRVPVVSNTGRPRRKAACSGGRVVRDNLHAGSGCCDGWPGEESTSRGCPCRSDLAAAAWTATA